MSLVADLVSKAQALGATFELATNGVRVSAPEPLPAGLIAELRQLKPKVADFLRQTPVSRSGECRACVCGPWDAQAGTCCEVCDGRLCVTCGNCLNASLLWRRAETDALYADVSVNELLERLRKGSAWLREQDQHYFDGGHEQAASDELFGKMWALWSDLELALRHVHGYEGCMLGPGEHCPEEGPVRCRACGGPY